MYIIYDDDIGNVDKCMLTKTLLSSYNMYKLHLLQRIQMCQSLSSKSFRDVHPQGLDHINSYETRTMDHSFLEAEERPARRL